METIFSHNPTGNELLELVGKANLTVIEYSSERSGDFITLDLALLFEMRKEQNLAIKYWAKIPDIKSEYQLGFDNILVAVK